MGRLYGAPTRFRDRNHRAMLVFEFSIDSHLIFLSPQRSASFDGRQSSEGAGACFCDPNFNELPSHFD